MNHAVSSPYSGHALVLARAAKRVKANALAKAIGIHGSVLSRYENDWQPIPEDVAIAIARELGIPLEALRVVPEASV
jgi:transcriptional regulator with XRE-family HTH domain